ncbi:MAG: hypothetical protein AAFN11_16625 [Chloroflexota bacterium]
MSKRILFVFISLTILSSFIYFSAPAIPSFAQPRITNTPINVSIPTTAPTSTPEPPGGAPPEVSPSLTFTPTEPLPNVTMISIAAPGAGLIRDFPQDGAVIGSLQSDLTYQVTGQYFSWIEFQFGNSPTGRAWTYIENVSLAGNLNEIPFIDPEARAASQQSPEEIATATALVFFQTPGVAETATAQARILEAPTQDSNASDTISEFPPTYTPPADIVALQPTSDSDISALAINSNNTVVNTTLESIAEGNIPPILPIAVLGLFGVLGLLIGLIRR